MQSVKPLLLVLLTYSLLSCAPQKAVPTTSGLGKTSQCGEILVGVTIEKRELEIAGATLKEFSLGKLDTRVTPEFQRITSEAAMNEDSKIKVACKAIEMAGVEGKPEMVAYFIEMQSFLSTNPSVDDRIKWKKAYPFPSATPQEQSNLNKGSGPPPEEPLAIRLAKVCKQPVVGLNRRPQAFLPIWIEVLLRLRDAKFEPDRTLQNLYNIKSRIRDPGYSAPDDFFRESLYTLRCLEDVGEVKLENLGTTEKYEGKVFENQLIVFRSP